MVEIPDYLLKRSQEAKAKATGAAAPSDEGGEAAPAEETAPAPPAAEESAPAAETAPTPEVEAPPEPVPAAAAESVALSPAAQAGPAVPAASEPPKIYAPVSQPTGTHQGYRGAKVPGWLYPAYVLIPILAIGLLLAVLRVSNEEAASAGPTLPGGSEYAAQCAACHGPDGGGGSGPAMKDVATVFPDPALHHAWVKDQANAHSGPYGADNKGNAGKGSVPGAMPKFSGTMSDDQIWDVVIYERVTFGGEDQAVSMKAAGREAPAGGAEGGAEGGAGGGG